MFNWIKRLLWPSEEDKRVIAAINKLFEEYDVYIGPRGGMRKVSKPEFKEKHR